MKRTICLLASLILCAPLLASANDGWVVADVDLQSGPDSSYPPIEGLAAGTPVMIEGCIEGWTWCDVISDESRGWVPGSFIEEDYDNQTVGIIDYGQSIGIPIVTFSLGAYWDSYYRGRPFYAQRQEWIGREIHSRPPPRPARIVASRPGDRFAPTRTYHSLPAARAPSSMREARPASQYNNRAQPRSATPAANRSQPRAAPKQEPRKEDDHSHGGG